MDCIFCNNIEYESLIKETNNFFVYIGKGLITAGHVLLIPKKHYRALAELTEEEFNEFNNLKKEMHNAIDKNFATPFYLEHGVFGQSVKHAHMHAIPSSGEGYSNINIINELVLPAIQKLKMPYVKMNDFSDLQKIYKEDGQYLYFEQGDDKYILRTLGFDKGKIRNDVIYRAFFTYKKGLNGVNSLKEMSESDILNDNKKRILTKKKLNFAS